MRPPLRSRPRLLLLNPPKYRGVDVVRLFRSEYAFLRGNTVPPMDLAYFAAAAPDPRQIGLLDANGEDLDMAAALRRVESFRPEIIVTKGVLNLLRADLEVARAYKERHPETRVVLACRGALTVEEQVLAEFPFLDAIARGEIDAFASDLGDGRDLCDVEGLVLPGAAAQHEAGTIRVVEDLDAHPLPDLDALPPLWHTRYRVPYWGTASGYFITASRGCPYGCSFCLAGHRAFRHRRRDPKNVVEELRLARRRFGIDDVLFFDEIFTIPAHARGVCEALTASGAPQIRFVCEGKPDLVDDALLALMRRAGCFCVYYGMETGDDAILAAIDKGHTVADVRSAVAATRRAGMLAAIYLMLGFPDESFRSFWRTVRLLRDLSPDLIRFDALAPYPCTPIHAEMTRAGLLGHRARRRGLQLFDRRLSATGSSSVGGLARPATRHLSPWTLAAMELALKVLFHEELARIPRPS